MIPSWILNSLFIALGCIFAMYLGATLPEYDMLGAYVLFVSIVCALCCATNNLGFLLAFGMSFPFAPPIPVFTHFPTTALVLGWIGIVLFFRKCLAKTLKYVPSCNWLIFICFLWVPVRIFLSPVHQLGAQAGGSGVSGLNTYFLYVVSIALVIMLGAILNTRQRLISFTLWLFLRLSFIYGLGLLICAFVPATAPYLAQWGMFAAGNLEDGIQRLVLLPAFGMNLVLAALCPSLFRLKKRQALLCLILGMAMVVVGANRSTLAALVIAIPLILILRRSYAMLVLTMACFILGVGLLRVSVSGMETSQIPALLRSFGIFDEKINTASGGDASAEWRYKIWASGIEKIEQSPLLGNGFGNLPKHLQLDAMNQHDPQKETDFEVVLAMGEAHNGFISTAYGFGIPFMIGLTLCFILRLASHIKSALLCDRTDHVVQDFHAWVAGNIATFGVLIYSASDMCSFGFWLVIAMGIILDHFTTGLRPQESRSHSFLQDMQLYALDVGQYHPTAAGANR